MNRDEVVWYYRLGGQTLGPVAWSEIEALTKDTIDAKELLVARGGDAGWTAAADVVAANPELAAAAPVAPEVVPAGEPVAPGDDWSTVEEREPAEEDRPWATPEPSGAATEVLGAAAVERDTGPARPAAIEAESGYPEGMQVKDGLGGWIGQAWEVVTGDLGAWIGAVLLAGLITVVTVGIAGPAMQTGLCIMALRKLRGQRVSAGMVTEGFQHFGSSFVAGLLIGLMVIVPALVVGFAVGALIAAGGEPDRMALQFMNVVLRLFGQLWGALVAAGAFYTFPLIADRGLGGLEAIQASWAVTKQRFASYFGISIVINLVAQIGMLACIVGVLITAPMAPVAQVSAYRYHFRGR